MSSLSVPSPLPLDARKDVARNSSRSIVRDYADLFKVRVTGMVLLTVWCAAYLAVTPDSAFSLNVLDALVGIGLVAAGNFALNEVFERDVDAKMRRTCARPLVTGRISTGYAAATAAIMIAGGAAARCCYRRAHSRRRRRTGPAALPAFGRKGVSASRGLRPRIQYDLYALLLLVAEELIGVGSFFQGQPVSDHKRWINIAVLNSFQEWFQIFMDVRLPHPESERLGKSSAKRNFVQKSAVYPGNGDSPTLAASLNCLP